MKIIWIFIVAALAVTGVMAQTCVPDTMARLSEYSPITNSMSAGTFAKLLRTSDGTYFPTVEPVWNKKYPSHPIVRMFSRLDGKAFIDDKVPIEYNTVPYLWIGHHKQGDHCALLFFQTNGIILSHSQFYPGTTNYYTEKYSYDWMFTNSYCIWKVKD